MYLPCLVLLEQMPECERGEGQDEHHAAGHELFCFGQANGEHDQQRRHDDVGEVAAECRSQHAGHGAQDQQGRRHRGSDQRNLAARLQEPDHAADQQKYNVNPKDGVLVHILSARKLAGKRPKRHNENQTVSRLSTSPGSHWATISKGRQHTSQSVVNRWSEILVSTMTSKPWPQKGHWTVSDTSMGYQRIENTDIDLTHCKPCVKVMQSNGCSKSLERPNRRGLCRRYLFYRAGTPARRFQRRFRAS